MKRVKGGEEVRLLSGSAHMKQEQRGGNERAERTAKKRRPFVSIGPARETARQERRPSVSVLGAGKTSVCVCVCVCVYPWLPSCGNVLGDHQRVLHPDVEMCGWASVCTREQIKAH